MLDELRSFSRSLCLFGSIIVAGVILQSQDGLRDELFAISCNVSDRDFPSKTLVRMDFCRGSQKS